MQPFAFSGYSAVIEEGRFETVDRVAELAISLALYKLFLEGRLTRRRVKTISVTDTVLRPLDSTMAQQSFKIYVLISQMFRRLRWVNIPTLTSLSVPVVHRRRS
jgi:hypothetical protein